MGVDTASSVHRSEVTEVIETEKPSMETSDVEVNLSEQGTVESAAAKKKRKKKEKEKEKKAAAAEAASTSAASTSEAKDENQEIVETKTKANQAKGKASDKKLDQIRKALAKLKEEEERRKTEEEERRRKEEEEIRKLEEDERKKKEARLEKRKKEKERVKEKKEREEARQQEVKRNQLINAAGGLPLPTRDTGKPVKRPLYQKNKSNPVCVVVHANGASLVKPVEGIEEVSQHNTGPEVDSVQCDNVEGVEEKSSVGDSVKVKGVEEEKDDDDEWNAKSWEDDVVNISIKHGFSDEEVDFEPEPVQKKNCGGAKPTVSDHKVVPSQPIKSIAVELKKNQLEVKVDRSGKKHDAGENYAAPPSSVAGDKDSESSLRSPICCIMGHVDAGKTKLLDCIRGTKVQEGEAGGITQQIGATYFPAENILERTKVKAGTKLKVPGLLVIDTPGHEAFINLRSRGSGLCDIAILVVDIMHGLEPQTIESLNLLKMRNTEFIIALNKVDRIYGWKTCRNAPIVKAMQQQSKEVLELFDDKLKQIITQFKEQGINTQLYYKNKEMGTTYSIVPTSALTGEGIPDLLLLLAKWTEESMVENLTYKEDVQCTVLEVRVIEGHGTTIDVVLVNGVLHEGDRIVVCGMQGPIDTSIRALLTPHPMKELRVKGTYRHHSEVKAAQCIKITAQGLQLAIAGTALYKVGPCDDLDEFKEAAMADMKSVMSRIDKSGEGVCVQASTLGSLEALLEFLKTPEVNIPVSGISIGPVHEKHVRTASAMLEKKKEFGTILAFDVKVTPEARELAKKYGVVIFTADIIYHLFKQFKTYIDDLKEKKKKESAGEAVFPCVLKVLPGKLDQKTKVLLGMVINKDPLILGVDVLRGVAKVGTPICICQEGKFVPIGRISSIKNKNIPVETAEKGMQVSIKISRGPADKKMEYFEATDELVSHISRTSTDALEAYYKDDLSKDDRDLLQKLKKLFKVL